jgi:PAS domain S-box-containing protein
LTSCGVVSDSETTVVESASLSVKRVRSDSLMLGIAALILLAMAGMVYRDWVQYRRASADADHSRGILDSIQRLFSTVQDAETGQRGYLLTGEEKYLEPYYLAIQLASGEMATLKSLLTRPEDKPEDVTRLRALLDEKLAELHRTIELRRSQGLQAALGVVLTDRGKQLMDQIRQSCTGIQTREYSALIDGSREEESYARQTELVMIAGSLILFAFLMAASVATNRAVLAREQSLGETREARDLLETTLTSIGDAVIATDAEGRIVFSNPTARGLLRAGDTDLAGRPLQDVFRIVNEYTRATVESPVAKVMREGTVVGLANHTILIAQDGTEIPIDDSGAPVRGADGKIRGTVLVFRDITERKRAEEATRLLAEVVESSDDAIISKDLDGRVTSWNKGAERLFGYSAAEMIGRPISVLAPPDRVGEMPAILERIKRGEGVEHFESIRRGKDGRLVNVSLTVSPILDASGRIVGASKIARDITERTLAEQSIAEQADRLARSNANLQQFTYAASHDLQEPLRTVVTFTQLLADRYGKKLDGEANEFMNFVISAARRMQLLITDLLSYSRSVHHEDVPLKEVSLNDAVDLAAHNLQLAIEESGAVLETGRLPAVYADKVQMIQLFQNLISNAIKYKSKDSPRIQIAAEQNGEEWVFSVCDNGIGIPTEYKEYVFGVFKRLHGNAQSGTGVGLAICKSIVERHGGRIWVESEPGQGSTFKFSISAKGASGGAAG